MSPGTWVVLWQYSDAKRKLQNVLRSSSSSPEDVESAWRNFYPHYCNVSKEYLLARKNTASKVYMMAEAVQNRLALNIPAGTAPEPCEQWPPSWPHGLFKVLRDLQDIYKKMREHEECQESSPWYISWAQRKY
jgi:hypothetical protein